MSKKHHSHPERNPARGLDGKSSADAIDDEHSALVVSRARQEFDALEARVPDTVAHRLASARQAALGEMPRAPHGSDSGNDSGSESHSPWPSRWLTVGAPVAAFGLLVAAVVLFDGAAHPPSTLPDLDEMEMAAAQDMEMLEELEFLAWLVEQEDPDALNAG